VKRKGMTKKKEKEADLDVVVATDPIVHSNFVY
jgi:hypothetical protein